MFGWIRNRRHTQSANSGPRIVPPRDFAEQVFQDEEVARGATSAPEDYSTLLEELERSKHSLFQAQGRIADLTQDRFALNGTVGRLTEMASTDALTGLSNRRAFIDALEEKYAWAVREDMPLSAIMIDVDSFKLYNDTFGHSAGDVVLWTVAKLLLRSNRREHVLARYGGEEFVVLLPSADASQALESAERQRSVIASYPWPLRPVTASFGVSTLGPLTTGPTTLLEESDLALYDSKKHGRNRVTHYQTLSLLKNRHDDELKESSSASGPIRVDPDSGSAAATDVAHHVSHPEIQPVATPPPTPERPSSSREPLARGPQDHAAWDALERFIQISQQGKKVPDQYRSALLAIREGTAAEVVFLCADHGDRVVEAVGDHVPSIRWYQHFTERLIEELPHGGIWSPRALKLNDSNSSLPEPFTAIALPVQAPKPSWLVALRFREGPKFLPAELSVVRVIWQLQLDHNRNSRYHDNLKDTLFGLVRCLSTAMDAKDPYTCGHSERVARIAVRLGEEMELPRGEISDLYLAGLLHDVGKLGIRDDVLKKVGPLTPEERLHMQEHPVIGERIIANVTRLAYLRPGVRGHHERHDGTGYPDALSGEAIPRMARILAVADACDAMMSGRRYRGALSQGRIEEIFRAGAGTQWDAQVVEHFFNCRHELYAVCQRGLGQSVYRAVERAVGEPDAPNRGLPANCATHI